MPARPWDPAYLDGPPDWETGRPQPVVAELAARGRLSGSILDVGCGTGENAILAARQGSRVLGIDLSGEAIRLATEKALARGVSARFRVADALSLHTLGETFDVVLDSGFFHTLAVDELPRYAASLAVVVSAGSTLYITCISDREPGEWGPRRVSEQEIRDTFGAGWTIEELRECVRERRPEPRPTARAWLATIRRVDGPPRRVDSA